MFLFSVFSLTSAVEPLVEQQVPCFNLLIVHCCVDSSVLDNMMANTDESQFLLKYFPEKKHIS